MPVLAMLLKLSDEPGASQEDWIFSVRIPLSRWDRRGRVDCPWLSRARPGLRSASCVIWWWTIPGCCSARY